MHDRVGGQHQLEFAYENMTMRRLALPDIAQVLTNVHQPTSPLTNQPTSPLTNQPTNQPIVLVLPCSVRVRVTVRVRVRVTVRVRIRVSLTAWCAETSAYENMTIRRLTLPDIAQVLTNAYSPTNQPTKQATNQLA